MSATLTTLAAAGAIAASNSHAGSQTPIEAIPWPAVLVVVVGIFCISVLLLLIGLELLRNGRQLEDKVMAGLLWIFSASTFAFGAVILLDKGGLV